MAVSKNNSILIVKGKREMLAFDSKSLELAIREIMGIESKVGRLGSTMNIKVENIHSAFAVHKKLRTLFDMRIDFSRPNKYEIILYPNEKDN